MLGRRPKKSPQAKGQGAAVAKQLGLFVDFNPEEMLLGAEEGGDDGDLEAELAALTGAKVKEGKLKQKGKTPLPMDHIEKMAAECMKDLNDNEEEADDEDLEQDTDLLAELQEVLGVEGETGSCEDETIATEPSPDESENEPPELQSQTTSLPAVTSELQQAIEKRIGNYRTAISNAKESGETAKVRRYERGLKTLETMLAAVKKGKKINEEEMPPPVATGKSSSHLPQATGAELENLGDSVSDLLQNKAESAADDEQKTSHEAMQHLESESLQGHAASSPTGETDLQSSSTRAILLMRQKEYKLAAVKAKQQGDLEKAKEYMKIGKKFDVVLEALDSGQPIDLQNMPPSPQDLESLGNKRGTSKQKVPTPMGSSQDLTTPEPHTQEASASLQQPKTVLEALQQRLEKYKSAAAQAKASGDERKGRMHERIAKQYQDAIRAHKAGRKVNFSELPVPPGFPPLPGVAATEGDSSIAGVLESASKLANMEENDEEDESEPLTQAPLAKKPAQLPGKPTQVVKPMRGPAAEGEEQSSPEHGEGAGLPCALDKARSLDHLPLAAREQLEFLENRKKQYMKAAVKAKKEYNLEQAKMYLKTAKSFDPKIDQAKCGKPVDISKLPSPPTDDEGDFIFIHHEDVRLSQKADEVYAQLIKLLKDQHERCLQYSKQFMHLGNVAETTRFEKLAQGCKKDMDILQLARAQGMEPPSHHFEERTFKMIRIFSELNSTEMHLLIVRGINLPAPPGVSPRDLDAFVKFEFQYPSAEQPQKSKTSVINNNNSPEYNQLFKLNINRNHRGFRRAVRSKGIKFEVFHKGSFFRSDKQVGTAHLKLEKLESECEVREIIEIFDGRKPTGGKLEVKVRLREPLSGQDLQTVTENWLVLEH
ncbi:coiled-coil and C2 domain-containing protein 1B [Colius striatus]|uniref:coiled-coil and C2 domain-containing protein 1B n=1 Tax=Colius striatus TaxID=57412 RepID=UPI002B1E85C5|nr:coiled-coil and C2 domain-containing protein 1B [Colius striatus]XP_061859423.1 coiled-coil and C2 domain-containing protein 1B [Colius striatus]